MALKNYYDLLGVKPNASQKEIQTAFRKLALKLHPDKNNGDNFMAEMFKNINEANDTLSNPQKRQQYDQTLREIGSKQNNNQTHNQTENFNNLKKGVENLVRQSQLYFKQKDVTEIKRNQYLMSNAAPKPKYLTFKKILWTVLILLVLFWITKPTFKRTIFKELNFTKLKKSPIQWKTLEQSQIYIEPDIESQVIGSLKNDMHLESLKETNYFILIEYTDDYGGKSKGYVRKRQLSKIE